MTDAATLVFSGVGRHDFIMFGAETMIQEGNTRLPPFDLGVDERLDCFKFSSDTCMISDRQLCILCEANICIALDIR